MTTETETNRGAWFVASLLPWLLGAVMFAAYFATMGHSVDPANVSSLTRLSGWEWRPEVSSPLTYLVTFPFRWVPANLLPAALNIFAALCAGLSLALLARSVALLPHDRTDEQRQREQSEFSVLTIHAAWIPPVLAVLVCGLQMTFWEQAVAWTGEMLDLLVFAYVIRCLLEYRISQRESWIMRCAFVYGLGMANNWAMIGFFPLFAGALIWIKGVAFFNPRALLRTAGCGLMGLALIFFLPLMVGLGDWQHFGFWDALRFIVATDKKALMFLAQYQRNTIALLALTSLLPVFILSLRWASYFGDTSPLGIFLATATLHIVQGLFLLACLWVALDCQISPRHMVSGINFLTFYYLGALSIGYFSGYFLLVFGKRPASSRERTHPLLKLVNRCVTVLVVLLAIGVPAVLVAKNLPDLRARQTSVAGYDKYISRMQESLPEPGAVVLSDDPVRLACLGARLRQGGDKRDCLLIDTASFQQSKFYLRFLEQKYPQFKLSEAMARIFSGTNAFAIPPDPLDLIKVMDHLAETHALYYLHPSFGYYFERFRLEPEGVIYRLGTYPSNVWTAPLPTEAQIAKNQEFWKKAEGDDDLGRLRGKVETPEYHPNSAPLKWMMTRLHLTTEPDYLALTLGVYYSRALDYWGVELQKSGRYAEAGKCFEESQQFNPDNVPAKINLECNKVLRAGKKPVLQTLKDIEDRFGKLRDWQQILGVDGPFDDPGYCLQLGTTLARGGNYRQAIQQYDRARELSPDNLIPPLQLSQMYISMQDNPVQTSYMLPYNQGYANALNTANQALRIMPTNLYGLFFKSVALIKLGSYDKAIAPLNDFISIQTNNYTAIWYRAISYLEVSNLDAAKNDYETLAKAAPKAFQIYYGLGEIAYRRKETAAAIKYYELYLTNAPANLDEAKVIRTRLKELKTGAP